MNYKTHPGTHENWQDQKCGDCTFRVPISGTGTSHCRHSPPNSRPTTAAAYIYPAVTQTTPACSFWLHWKDGPDQ